MRRVSPSFCKCRDDAICLLLARILLVSSYTNYAIYQTTAMLSIRQFDFAPDMYMNYNLFTVPVWFSFCIREVI